MTSIKERESNVPDGLLEDVSRPIAKMPAAVSYNTDGQWVGVSMERLFAGGVNLYPEGVSIMVKPADIPLVRMFTGMTEEVISYNQDVIQDAYEYICANHVRLKYTDSYGHVSYESGVNILSQHRFAMLLFIREVSGFKPWVFSRMVNKKMVNLEVRPETLEYRKVSDAMLKGFDHESGSFVKTLKGGRRVYVSIPTMASALALSKFVNEKRSRGEEMDTVFTSIFPMLQRLNDVDVPEMKMSELYERYLALGAETVSKYVQIADWVNNEFTGNTLATVEGSQVKFPAFGVIKFNLMFSEEFTPEDLFEE